MYELNASEVVTVFEIASHDEKYVGETPDGKRFASWDIFNHRGRFTVRPIGSYPIGDLTFFNRSPRIAP